MDLDTAISSNSSSLLAAYGFRNGSLFQEVQGSWYTQNRSAYPLHDVDPGVAITFFPNDTVNLAFSAGNSNFSAAMPLLAMLLQPNATQVMLYCTYPLSGQYDVLPRFLFYSLLIVAMIFRRRGWIASAALATAMTYSTVASVHLFVLLSAYKWRMPAGERMLNPDFGWDSRSSKEYGDIDFGGILPVVTAAGIMIPPLLTWSSTYRVDQSRRILVYWSILIMVALVCVIILWHRNWTTNELPSFAYCTNPDPQCRWDVLNEALTLESYDGCDCVDFCGVVGPKAPLRRSAVMVPELSRKISQAANAEDTVWDRLQKAVWIVSLVHGAIAILYSHWSPERGLHTLYRLVSGQGSRDSPAHRLSRQRWTMRKIFARTVAGLFYFVAIASIFFYPALFVLNVVLSELVVARLPTSEHSDAIGAWSPWVALGLVLAAAVILRSNDDWKKTFSRRRKQESGKQDGRGASTEALRMDANFEKKKEKRKTRSILDILTLPGRYRFAMFWRWWKNPDAACDEFDDDDEHKVAMIHEISLLQKEIERRQHALEMYQFPQRSECLCSACTANLEQDMGLRMAENESSLSLRVIRAKQSHSSLQKVAPTAQ